MLNLILFEVEIQNEDVLTFIKKKEKVVCLNF